MTNHPRSSKPHYAQEELPAQNDWLSRLVRFNLQFGRFLRDAVGVTLLAFALMLLFALWGLTDGALLTWLAEILATWFGWGSVLVIFGIGYFGYFRERIFWRCSDAYLHM